MRLFVYSSVHLNHCRVVHFARYHWLPCFLSPTSAIRFNSAAPPLPNAGCTIGCGQSDEHRRHRRRRHTQSSSFKHRRQKHYAMCSMVPVFVQLVCRRLCTAKMPLCRCRPAEWIAFVCHSTGCFFSLTMRCAPSVPRRDQSIARTLLTEVACEEVILIA